MLVFLFLFQTQFEINLGLPVTKAFISFYFLDIPHTLGREREKNMIIKSFHAVGTVLMRTSKQSLRKWSDADLPIEEFLMNQGLSVDAFRVCAPAYDQQCPQSRIQLQHPSQVRSCSFVRKRPRGRIWKRLVFNNE